MVVSLLISVMRTELRKGSLFLTTEPSLQTYISFSPYNIDTVSRKVLPYCLVMAIKYLFTKFILRDNAMQQIINRGILVKENTEF